MLLADILTKVRQETLWKSYIATSTDNGKVLGGCVIREHQPLTNSSTQSTQKPFAELFLLAVDSNCQSQGLGRRILEKLKTEYSQIVTFADLRAVDFFAKMGFTQIIDLKLKKQLLEKIESCTSSQLMLYQKAEETAQKDKVLEVDN